MWVAGLVLERVAMWEGSLTNGIMGSGQMRNSPVNRQNNRQT